MASKTTYELQVKIGAKESSSWKKTLKNAETSLSGLNSLSNKIMAGIAAGAAASAATVIHALSEATETYTEFGQEMATVKSISGASEIQFLDMKEAALEAGRGTVFTASESAAALEYMSLAGWDAGQSIAGLMPILELAAATGKELQTTSDLVTDSMSALGIGVDGLNGYLDKLVMTNNKANSNAEELMQALVKAGGASRTLGASLDDTITSLGILANNGKKGEEAGTALNAIFVRLAGNADAIKELGKLGVNIWDSSGKFVGFKEGLEQIGDAMEKLTDEEKALSLKKIAGTNYYSQMAYLLDAVKEDTESGTSAWEVLEGQVENSSGALERMYATTTDTLENAQKTLQSAKEDMQIRIVDVFSDDAKEFVRWLAEELPNVTDSIVEFAEAHRGEFADALEKSGDIIGALAENGIAAGQWLIKHKGAVTGGLKGIASAIGIVKVAMTGIKIAELFTNPLSAAITVGGLAVTAIGAVAGAIRDAKEAAVQANLEGHFGDIALSIEEMDALARQIVGEDSLNGVADMLAAAAETASAIEDVTDVWNELKKTDWKIHVGFNMDTDDYSEYGQNIETYISSVEDYAKTKGYEVHIAASLLFGEGSWQDTEAGAFFANLERQLEQEGNALYDYLYNEVNGALLDGIIDIEEEPIVQEYLAKINSITAALADAESKAKLRALELKYDGTDLTPETVISLYGDISDHVTEVGEGADEAYQSALTEYYARLELDPLYSEADFTKDSAEAERAADNLKADALINGFSYMLDTIYATYGEEIADYQKAVTSALITYSGEEYDSEWRDKPGIMWDQLQRRIVETGPDEATRGAIADLLEPMEPAIEELYDMKDMLDGLDPETQAAARELLDMIESLQGLAYAESGVIANKVMNSSSYSNMKDWVETHYEALTGYAIEPAIEEMYSYSQEYLDEVFSQGLSTSTNLELNISPRMVLQGNLLGDQGVSFGTILHNAEGGIYTSPILTTFAEEGPEAAVPLDGSDRAKSLWVQAGQILGMLPDGTRDQELLAGVSGLDGNAGAGRSLQIEFHPVITIQGNASKEDVQHALSLSLDELRDMLKEIQEEERRVSFG